MVLTAAPGGDCKSFYGSALFVVDIKQVLTAAPGGDCKEFLW